MDNFIFLFFLRIYLIIKNNVLNNVLGIDLLL